MIPKASQRGLGQDLATHLLNEFDNEYVEVAQVSGAVAGDLHGAFAEWEAIAAGLTKCRNYLYSLSVNPDLGQGQLTREQYLDYLDRVEARLGLEGQPRAVVFHIKDGREHCHAVWSRISASIEIEMLPGPTSFVGRLNPTPIRLGAPYGQRPARPNPAAPAAWQGRVGRSRVPR